MSPQGDSDGMAVTGDMVLPVGLSAEHVTIESSAEGFVNSDAPSNRGRAFNPQNGRFYDTDTFPDYDRLSASAGVTVECAYAGCGGTDDIVVDVEIDQSSGCRSCGEPMMGRVQFSDGYSSVSSDHSAISSRMKDIDDEFAREMNRLTEAGVGTVPAMDFIMCSIGEIPYEEWAEARGVNAETVMQNLRKVADGLQERVYYHARGY